MFSELGKFFRQLGESFKKIPPAKRVVILLTSVSVTVGFLFLIFWGQQSEYGILFSRLTAEDTSAIIEKLKSRRIDYKLNDSGKSILVPQNLVYELRLDLAGEGLPQSGNVGFELFDKSSFGMTEFVQKLNYLRAIQGELARSISQLEEVDTARVHVVLPKKVLFKEDQKKTTASIILKLKGGRRLGPGQIQGVTHLVGSAVEGLAPEDITVIDIHGNILSGGGDSSTVSRLTASQLDYKQNYEKDLIHRVQSMLENILGQGKAIVRASADLSFLQEERMEEIYDPDSQVARSKQKVEDTSVGATSVSGVPGVQSSLPGGSQLGRSGSPPRSSKVNETVNYELNKITRKLVEPVGKLIKLSIAVVLDGTYEPAEEGGGAPQFVERTPGEIKKYMDLVKSAVGFDTERGDIIEVTSMPFEAMNMLDERLAMESDANRMFWLQLVKYLLSATALIIVIVFLLKPILSWLIALEKESAMSVPKTVAELESELIGTPAGEEEVEENNQGIEDFRQRVVEFVTENPKGSAEMIRKWLKERAI